MNVTGTKIPDVKLIEPCVLGDERGFFMETWKLRDYSSHGIGPEFVQDNHSRSVKGTLRGLHYQIRQPQGKLVRVTRGEVFDVAIDLRRSSPTFGLWVGEYLSASNMRMLWIPPHFAHGFYVTSDVAEFQYKCTDYYAADYEYTIAWNDPDLDIGWPIGQGDVLLSAKDKAGKPFGDAEIFD